jgi:phosphoenolpyruvate carboxykinase (GTP)
MADYFGHWLDMGKRAAAGKQPAIFYVNWFRKDAPPAGGKAKFLWPGFGDNSRVVEWMFNRCAGGDAPAVETPIGYVPDQAKGGINVEGLGLSAGVMDDLLRVDPAVWAEELKRYEEFLATFGDRLPAGIKAQHERLTRRVAEAVARGGAAAGGAGSR